jgi:hypothetical protein
MKDKLQMTVRCCCRWEDEVDFFHKSDFFVENEALEVEAILESPAKLLCIERIETTRRPPRRALSPESNGGEEVGSKQRRRACSPV